MDTPISIPTPAIDSLPKLADRFPSSDDYFLSVNLLEPSKECLDSALELADAVDSLIQSVWNQRKTGEAHLSDTFLNPNLTEFIELPKLSDIKVEGKSVPVEPGEMLIPESGRFLKATFTATLELPDYESRTAEYTVRVDVYLAFSKPLEVEKEPNDRRVLFQLNAYAVIFSVDPALEDPNKFPPDIGAYLKRHTANEVFDNILQQLRGESDSKTFWTLDLPLPEDKKATRPAAIAFASGVSMFLHGKADPRIRRQARDRSYHYVIETSLEGLKKDLLTKVDHEEGSVGNNENNYESVKAFDVALDGPGHLAFSVAYRFHRFIAGKKGCNWAFCYDNRIWIGAKDQLPMKLEFSAEFSTLPGAEDPVEIVVTPQYEPYEAGEDAFYFKNMRLILDLADLVLDIKAAIGRLINDKVNKRLAELEAQKESLPMPSLPAGFSVEYAIVVLDGSDDEETMRIMVKFEKLVD